MSIFKKIQHCVLLILIGVFFVTADAHAGWFDSFTKSVVSNPTSSWTLQQQSHYAGGGFSVRFNQQNRPFISVTAPKISVGCGGIDAFWGGFSFLNPEYFIQMFRNILAAAPAFAFKLALETLCPSCADVLDTLTELANLMNSLAMDECSAAQALGYAGGAAVASLFGSKAEKSETDGSGSEWLKSLKEFKGRADKWIKELREKIEDKFCGFVPAGALKDSCIKVYATSGTLWERAVELDKMKNMSGNRALDADFLKVIRAIVGDIELTAGNDNADKDGNKHSEPAMMATNPIPPCDGATPEELLTAMISTEATKQDVYLMPEKTKESCTKGRIPETLQIAKKAKAAIDDIEFKMFKKGVDLESATIDIVRENVLPIYKMVNLFALRTTTKGGSFMGDGEKEMMIELTAIGHAAYIINTSMIRAASILAYVSSELKMLVHTAGGDGQSLVSAKDTMLAIIGQISDVFNKRLSDMQALHDQKISALTNVTEMQLKYEQAIVQAVLRNM